jgi:hypothetical protein
MKNHKKERDVKTLQNDYNNNIGGRDLKSLYTTTTIARWGR